MSADDSEKQLYIQKSHPLRGDFNLRTIQTAGRHLTKCEKAVLNNLASQRLTPQQLCILL